MKFGISLVILTLGFAVTLFHGAAGKMASTCSLNQANDLQLLPLLLTSTSPRLSRLLKVSPQISKFCQNLLTTCAVRDVPADIIKAVNLKLMARNGN